MTWLTIDVDVKPGFRMFRSLSELNDAISKFKENYELFAAENKQFLLIESDFHKELKTSEA